MKEEKDEQKSKLIKEIEGIMSKNEKKRQRRKDIEGYLYDLFVFWPSFFSTASLLLGLLVYIICSFTGVESVHDYLLHVFNELGTAPMCIAMTPYLFRVYANPLIIKTLELFNRK